MTKGQIFAKYKHLSPQDRRAFNLWLRANAVVGVLLAVAAVTVALNGSRTQGPSAAPATQAQNTSFQELHSLAHLDNLPVDHLHNQALIFAAPERETRSVTVSEAAATNAD
jgi:hypothetical protein